MILPSKELLDEIFSSHEIITFGKINPTEILIQFDGFDEVWNIYELMHLMKEWAYTFDYCISSEYGINESRFTITTTLNSFICDGYADKEFEAVCQACELVLKEINNA